MLQGREARQGDKAGRQGKEARQEGKAGRQGRTRQEDKAGRIQVGRGKEMGRQTGRQGILRAQRGHSTHFTRHYIHRIYYVTYCRTCVM